MEKILNLIPKLHVLQERKLKLHVDTIQTDLCCVCCGSYAEDEGTDRDWLVVVAGGCMRTAFYHIILIIPSYVLYVDFHYFIIIHSFIDSTKKLAHKNFIIWSGKGY